MAAGDVWREHVERLGSSGLIAAQYAERWGINASSLKVWRWKLGREIRQEPAKSAVAALVELRAPEDQRVELELHGGQRLRFPATFDAVALRRLLDVLVRRVRTRPPTSRGISAKARQTDRHAAQDVGVWPVPCFVLFESLLPMGGDELEDPYPIDVGTTRPCELVALGHVACSHAAAIG
jgi:transposase-like protein